MLHVGNRWTGSGEAGTLCHWRLPQPRAFYFPTFTNTNMTGAQISEVGTTLLTLNIGSEIICSNRSLKKYTTFVKVFFFCKEQNNKLLAA
jgi:hypothetical protein